MKPDLNERQAQWGRGVSRPQWGEGVATSVTLAEGSAWALSSFKVLYIYK